MDRQETDSERQVTGRIGERQVVIRLEQYGWKPALIDTDLGEDIYVRIYKQNVSLGLKFEIQVKSTKDFAEHQLQSGLFKLPIETKKLVHWNVSHIPLFLWLWDINNLEGRWIHVNDELLEQIDETHPNWRMEASNDKSIVVHFPDANRTDDAGLERIYQIVYKHFEPILKSRPFTSKLRCKFPDTPEGQRTLNEIAQNKATGSPYSIPGKFIEEFRFPEWWERLNGPLEVTDKSVLIVGQSHSEKPIQFRLKLLSSQRLHKATLNVEMRAVQVGEEQAIFSNAHLPTPLRVSVTFLKDKELEGMHYHVNYSVPGSNPDVLEARSAIPFVKALCDGGIMEVSFLSDGSYSKPCAMDVPAGSFELTSEFEDILARLCLIQERLGCRLFLKDWGVTRQHISELETVEEIFRTGKIVNEFPEIRFKFNGLEDGDPFAFLEYSLKSYESDQPVTYPISTEELSLMLLESYLPLGPSKSRITGYLNEDTALKFKHLLEQEKDKNIFDGGLETTLINGECITEFLDWCPNSELP